MTLTDVAWFIGGAGAYVGVLRLLAWRPKQWACQWRSACRTCLEPYAGPWRWTLRVQSWWHRKHARHATKAHSGN